MCGIAGIYAYGDQTPGIDKDELLSIRDHMIRRGPDGCGEWYSPDGRIGLAHRRLAIIDLSEGAAQPMASADGRFVISFNGEIYNYQKLKARLEAKGYIFRSTSDTEVILHLYAEMGTDMLQDLRGMYAFSIWDVRDRSLFLARDPFGIKPLYYANNGNTFRFASQVKALLAGGQIDTNPEPAGHVGFFLWGHVPDPYTMYKGIKALPAGSWMKVSQDRMTVQQFSSISDLLLSAEHSLQTSTGTKQRHHLREALLDSVRHHLVADVPVGLFLSSGLDSTTLTALAVEIAPDRLQTITLGFNEYLNTRDDEVPLAELAARHYGTLHRTIRVMKRDFQDDYTRILESMDQPTTDGVNSYFVCKAAAQAGLKVALSGLGGDELFGSYPSFKQIPRLVNRTRPFTVIPGLGKGFRLLSTPILKHFTSPKYAGLLEYGSSYGGGYLLRRGMFMPWELPDLLDGDLVREGLLELHPLLRLEETVQGIKNEHLKISALEMTWYMRNQLLRDSDWASMAHSLEVRVPLVDLDLLRSVAPLFCAEHRPDKRDMAMSPLNQLPEAILDKKKGGFIVPVREWLMEDDSSVNLRGLRGWTRKVYAETVGESLISASHRGSGMTGEVYSTCRQQPVANKRILALVTDAFGGHGGIALYNRDLLTALCSMPDCANVVAIPRLMPNASEPQPANLTYITSGVNSKFGYVKTVMQTVNQNPAFDLIVCGHINLIPIAMMLRSWLKVPVLLEIYGIDVWQPTNSKLTNRLVQKVDAFVSISEITGQRFLSWSRVPAKKGFLLPNAIHAEQYGPGSKNPELLQRYGLKDRTVLMTLGRLVSHERYKGFDEIIELLPDLAREIPGIAYLIVGKGDDQQRLEAKARTLGVADRVVFTGFIQEVEKADHFRLADAYVMPSQGEGFGFVFLEALACGIPCIGSTVDGSREALRGGELGILVDPSNPEEIKEKIISTLKISHREVPEGLQHFSFKHFTKQLSSILDHINTSKA